MIGCMNAHVYPQTTSDINNVNYLVIQEHTVQINQSLSSHSEIPRLFPDFTSHLHKLDTVQQLKVLGVSLQSDFMTVDNIKKC